jgi:hypothetical protein
VHLAGFVLNYAAFADTLGSKRDWPMSRATRVQVILPEQEATRFDAYCREKGFKKSTLIARLVREYLEKEGFQHQQDLFPRSRYQRGEGEQV